eukprot:483436-Prorocentrum_minimum.AAC.1
MRKYAFLLRLKCAPSSSCRHAACLCNTICPLSKVVLPKAANPSSPTSCRNGPTCESTPPVSKSTPPVSKSTLPS